MFLKFICVPKLTPEYFIILSHSTLFTGKHSMILSCPLGNSGGIQPVWKMTSSCSTKLITFFWVRARHGSYKSALLTQSSILSIFYFKRGTWPNLWSYNSDIMIVAMEISGLWGVPAKCIHEPAIQNSWDPQAKSSLDSVSTQDITVCYKQLRDGVYLVWSQLPKDWNLALFYWSCFLLLLLI